MKFLVVAVVVCIVDVAIADNFNCDRTRCIEHVGSSNFIIYPKAGGNLRMGTREGITADESCNFCFANRTEGMGWLVVAVDSAIYNDGETVQGVLYHSGKWNQVATIQPYTGADDGEWMTLLEAVGGIRIMPNSARRRPWDPPSQPNKVLFPNGESGDDEIILSDICESHEWQIFHERAANSS